MSFETTHNYQAYSEYLNLKKEWVVDYKGVNLLDAVSVFLADIMLAGTEADWYHIFCSLFKRLDVKPIAQKFATTNILFSFNAPRRRDHLKLSHAMADSVVGSAWLELKFKYVFFGWGIRWIRFYNICTQRTNFSLKNRLLLAAAMASYSRDVDELDKYFANKSLMGKIYLPFCGVAYEESLLTLYFKTKGVRTFYTPHGNFGRYAQVVATDVVNGENLRADQVLVFGNLQRDDLIHDFNIDPNIVKVVGNPKYPKHNIQLKNTFKSCIILGGIGLYDANLISLLPIIEQIGAEYNISFAFKPHPSSRIAENGVLKQYHQIHLIERSVTLEEIFQSGEYDFAITNNTSAYYECMYWGIKPFRWAINENLNFAGLDDRFASKTELEQLILKSKSSTIDQLSADAERLLIDVLGMGINNYNEIINHEHND